MDDEEKTKLDSRPYDAQEREDVWTAIDNLQSAISTIRNELEAFFTPEGLEWLDHCIETVTNLI